MKKSSKLVVSPVLRGLIAIAVVLTAVSAGFWYERQSSAKETAASPSSLGKIYYQYTYTTFGGTYRALMAANADGTGVTTIVAAGVPPLSVGEPSWAPDGTRFVYNSDGDIWLFTVSTNTHVNLTNSFTTPVEAQPSISVTGKIAYERENRTWTMNADGSSQAPFNFITQPVSVTPTWSPDGTKLAFLGGGGDIWVIDANGSNERRVTDSSMVNPDISWSPDGTKLLFTKGGTSVAVINLDGTNEQILASGGQVGKPAWSNDGTKIAFVRTGTTENGIYTMDAVGNNQIRVLADLGGLRPAYNSEPAWQPMPLTPNTVVISGRITRNGESLPGVTVSLTRTETIVTTTNSLGEFSFGDVPSGGSYTVTPTLANHIFTPPRKFLLGVITNRIADFTAGQTCSTPGCKVNGKVAFVRGTDIFISNADGTNQVNLTNGGGINEDPAFSPDGGKVTFRTNRDGNYEIYRINVDGTGIQRLTNAAGTDEFPVYSSDGSKIVFTSDRDGNQEIYTMNSDGSNQQRLTNNSVRDTEASFSPDGTKIVFSRVYETVGNRQAIFSMNADGSNAVQITSPGTLYDFTPTYSPDGTKLLFWRYDSGPFTSEFFIANANGSNPVTLGITGRVYKPSFSPDGTKIIYSRLFDQFTYNVEYATIGGGPGGVMVTNGHHNDWQPVAPAVRRPPFDFDGDGKSDVSVFRPSEGMWYILRSSDSGLMQTPFAIAGDVPAPGDFDGDSKADIGIYRPSSNDFWSLSTVNGQHINYRLGQSGDIPMPSDVDGDSRTDYVVYRPSNGHWYRMVTSTGTLSDIWFGAVGDKPVIGDFNGDGKADPAVYRPSDGNWWWLSSADGVQRATRWGIAEDIPTPADFDGDGKTDFAVFRPSTGVWYIYNSSNGTSTIFPFGLSSDKPVPTDYDGDGKADVAVYRPSDGIWYILRSTAGFTGFRWGIASDVPVPNVFVR